MCGFGEGLARMSSSSTRERVKYEVWKMSSCVRGGWRAGLFFVGCCLLLWVVVVGVECKDSVVVCGVVGLGSSMGMLGSPPAVGVGKRLVLVWQYYHGDKNHICHSPLLFFWVSSVAHPCLFLKTWLC